MKKGELDFGVEYSASCQHCLSELMHDGDNYVCEGCGVYFDERGSQAYFIDDDADPCGEPYPQPTPVHDVHVSRKGVASAWGRFDLPCDLPKGHTTAEHHHPHHFIHCIPEATA